GATLAGASNACVPPLLSVDRARARPSRTSAHARQVRSLVPRDSNCPDHTRGLLVLSPRLSSRIPSGRMKMRIFQQKRDASWNHARIGSQIHVAGITRKDMRDFMRFGTVRRWLLVGFAAGTL